MIRIFKTIFLNFLIFNVNTFSNFDLQLRAKEIREDIKPDSSSGCIEYCFSEIKEDLLKFYF